MSVDRALDDGTAAPPLLGHAFPPNPLSATEHALLARLEIAIRDEIGPNAARHDQAGRYPTASIEALKQTGLLAASVPASFGGPAVSSRFAMEAQLRLAAADSAVAQIFKIHDEIVREIFTIGPPEVKPLLARRVVEDRAIVGLAVAEAGRDVLTIGRTIFTPHADGGGVINGRKIYTTGAAEADYIAVWAALPVAAGEAGRHAIQLTLVAAGTPGVSIARDWDALGQRATDSGTIVFEEVRTDPLLRASLPEKAPHPHASLRYQLGFAAIMIGLGVGALAAAIPFIGQQSRPWPSAGVENAADDPMVRRLAGELTADLVAAYGLLLAAADQLDAADAGLLAERTRLAIPIYAAKAVASRAGLRATSEIYTLMGTRSVARPLGFDRFWRNARVVSLHDPLEWKYAEIGRHVLSGWDPEPGPYQ